MVEERPKFVSLCISVLVFNSGFSYGGGHEGFSFHSDYVKWVSFPT